MSKGTVFHNLAADTEYKFSKRDVFKAWYMQQLLSTDRVLLLWVSETFVNKSVMYSGAR